MVKIAAIVGYCSNDYRFINKCLQELDFLDQLIVPVCDHFFDATPENRALLNLTYHENQNAEFIEFAYDFDQLYTPFLDIGPDHPFWGFYWHSTARLVGYYHLSPDIDYVFFIDSDEIFEKDKLKAWLRSFNITAYSAIRPFGLFYFRSPKRPAKILHTSVLLTKKDKLTPDLVFNSEERYGILHNIEGETLVGAKALDQGPLYHHYSWTKPKHEALKKATTWGHRHQRDWASDIKTEYEKPIEEQNEQFIVNTECFDLKPYFDPFTVEPNLNQNLPSSFDNVKCIDRSDIVAKWLLG